MSTDVKSDFNAKDAKNFKKGFLLTFPLRPSRPFALFALSESAFLRAFVAREFS